MQVETNYTTNATAVMCHSEAIDFMNTLPDKSVRLIITSPPYNIGKHYELRKDIQEYLKEHDIAIDSMIRILADNGSLCWQVGNYVESGEIIPLDIPFYSLFKKKGLKLRNRIIWHFEHGLHAKNRLSGRYETILWFTKSDNYVFNLDPIRIPSKYPGKTHFKGPNIGKPSCNPLGKNPSDVWKVLETDWEKLVWDIPNVKANHPEKTNHPCQFPIELVERCVLALTDENDWVYDPYAGVGSSVIAAINRDRRGMGSERDANYVGIALERITAYYAGLLKIRPLGKPIHQPTGKEKVAQFPKRN